MPRKTAPESVTALGIDMGKNTLHMVGLDARGGIVLREKSQLGSRRSHVGLQSAPQPY
jgi:hypothetical protein